MYFLVYAVSTSRGVVCSLGMTNISGVELSVVGVSMSRKSGKGMLGVRIVSTEGLQTELPVHEDDCIARF